MPMTDTIKATPTVYRGVEMRSKLEATVAQCFDDIGFYFWQYEPERFDFELDGGRWSYLPDFYVDELGYVEVKPSIHAFDLNRVTAFVKTLDDDDDLVWIAVPTYTHSYRSISFYSALPDGRREFGHKWHLSRRVDAEYKMAQHRDKVIRDLVNDSRSLDRRAVGEVLLAEKHGREPPDFYVQTALKSPALSDIDFRYFPGSSLAPHSIKE